MGGLVEQVLSGDCFLLLEMTDLQGPLGLGSINEFILEFIGLVIAHGIALEDIKDPVEFGVVGAAVHRVDLVESDEVVLDLLVVKTLSGDPFSGFYLNLLSLFKCDVEMEKSAVLSELASSLSEVFAKPDPL